MRRGERTAGFTYIWVLAALVMLSIGLAAVGPVWSEQVRREREQELLRVGGLYAKGIASYHAAAPGSLKAYPPSLQSLLVDTRYIGTYRHLRKLYADPLDPSKPWGLVIGADGGVRGVYSQSEGAPLAQTEIDLGVVALPVARSYAEWKFAPK